MNRKTRSIIKNVVDILGVFITVVGVAASLGLGTMQICGGLEYIFHLKNTIHIQIFAIVAISIIYIWTAVSGLDKGMKDLSNINLALATILCVGCFFIGPTSEIMNTFITGVGDYLNYFISESLFINPITSNEWVYKRRIFYWAFWISWGIIQGLFAIVFIMLGGLDILQRFAIVVSLPFAFVFMAIIVGLWKELRKEKI